MFFPLSEEHFDLFYLFKISSSKKKKIVAESRQFQEKLAFSSLLMEVNEKPVCSVSSKQISVHREYNIWHHYWTNHAERHNNVQRQMRKR